MDDTFLKLVNSSDRLVGLKQVVRGIIAGDVRCVFIARNTDEDIKQRLVALATQYGVRIEYAEDKALLGSACGIDVGASVVGLLS